MSVFWRNLLAILTGGAIGRFGYPLVRSWLGLGPPKPSWTGVAACLVFMLCIPFIFRYFSRKAAPPHA